jgi:hypothetical protein
MELGISQQLLRRLQMLVYIAAGVQPGGTKVIGQLLSDHQPRLGRQNTGAAVDAGPFLQARIAID